MVYKQVYMLGFKKSYEYRANFYLGLVSVAFPLTIQYFLWSGLFSASQNGIVFGYTFTQMLAYAVFASLVTKIISTSFVYEINTDIKEGGMAKYLVKPISYFKYNFMSYLGEKSGIILSSVIIIVSIWAGISLWEKSSFHFGQLLLFFLSLSLGLILNFVIFYSICSMAFWMIDAHGAIFITTLIGTIVSGGIFPLDIFSVKVQFLLHLLPFPYTSYFPISILCGTISGSEITEGFMFQMAWIGITIIISKVLWNYGTKRYAAVGG